MAVLYLLWLFLAGIFFSFCYMFVRQAQSPLRAFQMRQRAGEAVRTPEAQKMADDVVHDVNSYLDSVNGTHRTMNRSAAIASFISGLLALVSLVITIWQG